jgi:hypothetical protein
MWRVTGFSGLCSMMATMPPGRVTRAISAITTSTPAMPAASLTVAR